MTQNSTAHNAPPWMMLLEQLEEELEATTHAEQDNALRCQLALMHWDVGGGPGAATACLTGASAESSRALELMRQLLLSQGDAAGAADMLEDQALRLEELEDPMAGELLVEAALLHLFWLADPRRAIELCHQALELPHQPGDLTELLELALGAAGEFEALAGRALSEDLATLPTLISGALALWDRLGRRELALDLLLRSCDLDGNDPFVIELLLEMSARFPEVIDRQQFLGRKHELLARTSRSSPDYRAVSFDLCRAASTSDDLDRVKALLDDLGEPVNVEAFSSIESLDTNTDSIDLTAATDIAAWASLLLIQLQRDLAARTGDNQLLGETYESMVALCGVPALRRAYRLRAAQAFEQVDEATDRILSLLQRNLAESPADSHASTMLQRLLVATGNLAPLCGQYQAEAAVAAERKGQLLRWASLIAEAHLDDRALAAQLRRDGLSNEMDPFGIADMQRLCRSDDARLIDAYRRDADSTDEPSHAALLWGAIATLHLQHADLEEAEARARDALAAVPGDFVGLGVLAAVFRQQERHDELKQILLAQRDGYQSTVNRQRCLRELASLEQDVDRAAAHLEDARILRPEDTSTLNDLAKLHELRNALPEAIEVYHEIAKVQPAPDTAVPALIAAGNLYCRQANSDGAIEAFSEALRIDPSSADALDALANLYADSGRLDKLLEVLDQQLDHQPDATLQARLQLRIANTLEELGAPVDEVLAATIAAARAEPIAEALLKLHQRCRAHGLWELLAETLSGFPPEVIVLDLHAEALEHLGRLDSLASVRTSLLESASPGQDRADRAYDLGRVQEQRHCIDEALEAYNLGLSEAIGHRPSLRALQRIYQAAGDISSLQQMLQQELELESEPRRQVDLLLELAECARQTDNLEAATARLEEAFTLLPDQIEVIDALQAIYETTRPRDYARLLQHRASIETRDAIRSSLHQRAAGIYIAEGDDDAATAAFQASLEADPGNRDCFTDYEAHCYGRELWRELMEMYDAAIEYIASGDGARVYRLSDLYARRGQLQLEQLGQPGEAAASFLKVLEYDPQNPTTMAALQTIFVAQQDWRGLVAAYEHRATLAADDDAFRLESLRQAARLASTRLPPDDADIVRLWAEVFREDPTDEEAGDNLEHLYDLHGDTEQLADLLETRLALLPGDDDVILQYLDLAQIAEHELEDPERAARAYEAIRRINEHDERALKELARIYEATGRWEQCIEVLKDLVMIEVDQEERSLLYFKCGSIMEARFDDDVQAIRYYESSRGESPGCLPAIHGLRDLYLRREQWYDALRTLEHELRLWEGEKEEAGVLARMAEIRLHHMADEDKAIEEFEDALALDPECRPALKALFDLYFEHGKPQKALKIAVRLAPQMSKEGDPVERSRFFGRRGELLARDSEQLELAADSLVTALQLSPENIDALEQLIEIFRRSPDSYDYSSTFRELEQVYRSEGNATAVGHVLVAAGAVSEIGCDIETALDLYQQAEEAAPQVLTPARARANLLVLLRRTEEAVSVLRDFAERSEDRPQQIQALAAVGEIWADVEMDPAASTQAFSEVLALDPSRIDIGFRLAQELHLLGRHRRAQRTIEQAIEEASKDGVSDAFVAELHHYLGVVLNETLGSTDAAASFRRALQIDPSCARAAMALARHLVTTNAREAAEELLTHTIHEASRRSVEVLDLRRSLCGLLLGDGRFDEALNEYETIIDEGGGQVEDQLTIAGIYALEDSAVPQAVTQLLNVLESHPFNPLVLRMLAQFYDRLGEMDRMMQVMQVTESLGLVNAEDRAKVFQLRQQLAWKPTRAIDDRLKQQATVAPQDGFIERLWKIARSSLERVFPLELSGKAVAADQTGSADFRLMVSQCLNFLAVKASVMVAQSVPGGVVPDNSDRVIVDRLLLEQPPASLAFAIGRSAELLSSGHALIGRLAIDDRLLLVELLSGLLEQPDQRSDLADEFIRRLPRRAADQMQETCDAYHAAIAGGNEPQDAARWITRIEHNANRLGLLACDDIAEALRMLALLRHQELAVGPGGEVAIQLLADGPELVQFYLSDTYVRLRRQLARV